VGAMLVKVDIAVINIKGSDTIFVKGANPNSSNLYK